MTSERKAPSDDSEFVSYYGSFDEANQLATGIGHLEFARMQELIQRFLNPPLGVVPDVGGGPCRYSCWLRLAITSTLSIP